MNNMFCYQCQETVKNTACTMKKGVCGKEDNTANFQDLLIYNLKGISEILFKSKSNNININIDIINLGNLLTEYLFTTITNVNFDNDFFIKKIKETNNLKKELKNNLLQNISNIELSDTAKWDSNNEGDFLEKSKSVGILSMDNDDDKRSLKSLILYGLKGLSAYYHHASVLGYTDENIIDFFTEALSSTLDNDLSNDDLFNLVVKCGEYGVKTMALLDKANTETYSNPEPTEVNIGVKKNPGILVSGHDLKDMEELLIQTEGTGVDVYTHSEMLPANYYPGLKKYKHLAGNYGSSWWLQTSDFENFNGPILVTTNCLVPPKDTYKERLYTTGTVGFPGVKHIKDREKGKSKDFSGIIEHAKKTNPPNEIETGKIIGGFAHNYVLGAADKIIDLINRGKIKKFVVMAGCDGRHKSREYYTDFAKNLPTDTIILTAGCAKYRYNKLNLGDIEGIPRVLDAGQCNDSYSLAVIALKLAEALNVDINELPIVYNIAWYEQKAALVLLALLSLGVKNIHVGPTLPAFLSPNVAKIIIEKFNLAGIDSVENDIKALI